MDVTMKVAIVTKSETIRKGEKSFQAVKITAIGDDGKSDEFTFSGNVDDFAKIVLLEKCELKLKVGGYLNGYNQKLTIKSIQQKLARAQS